jgi:hypothetical protein
MIRRTAQVLGSRIKIKYSIAIYEHWRKADGTGIMVAAEVVRRKDAVPIIEAQSATTAPSRPFA